MPSSAEIVVIADANVLLAAIANRAAIKIFDSDIDVYTTEHTCAEVAEYVPYFSDRYKVTIERIIADFFKMRFFESYQEDLASVSMERQEDLKTANMFLNRKNYEQAARIFEQCLSSEPDEPRFHFGQALTQSGLGNIAKSLTSLERAIELDSKTIQLRFYMAEEMIKMGRVSKGANICLEILELDESRRFVEQVFICLAWLYLSMGRFEEAAEFCRKTIARYDRSKAAHALLV